MTRSAFVRHLSIGTRLYAVLAVCLGGLRTANASQGGLALRATVAAHVGDEVEIVLQGERLRGRVVEAGRTILRLQFRHDQATADLVDRLTGRLAA